MTSPQMNNGMLSGGWITILLHTLRLPLRFRMRLHELANVRNLAAARGSSNSSTKSTVAQGTRYQVGFTCSWSSRSDDGG